MAGHKSKRNYKSRRTYFLRRDAKVGSGQARIEIETTFGLPTGSVRLLLPSGRPARSDKSIDALLLDWGIGR